MKRFFLAVFATALIFTFCVQAESTELHNSSIAIGNVSSVRFIDVVAPFSGTLNPFDLNPGDEVKQASPLLSFQTTPFYAPEDGTVGALFGAKGNNALAISQHYGGIMAIEPLQRWQLEARTEGAYNDIKNRTLQLGETLYFKSGSNKRDEGQGRVIFVDGKNYRVELPERNFDVGEIISLFRKDDYTEKSNVGKGVIVRRPSVLVPGSGLINTLQVSEGQRVKAGDLLFDTLSPDAPNGSTPVLKAQENSVVGAVYVVPGQQVMRGQRLLRLFPDDEIEVVAQADEMDLGDLRVGDTLKLTLDTDESKILSGTLTKISALGFTKQNAAYYNIHVSLPKGSARLGASASVYLPKKNDAK